MSEWKKYWSRLPKLPRGWRIVRNLALSAAVAVGIQFMMGWPARDGYESFQRAEGAFLLTPSRLVLQVEGAWGPAFLSEGDSWITVGTAQRVTASPVNLKEYRGVIQQVLPKRGLVLAALPAKNEQNGAIVALWGAPEEAVSGTLELELMGIEDPWHEREVPGLESFTAQARRREDGWFIFQFVPHSNHRKGQSCAMEMLLSLGGIHHPGRSAAEQPYRLILTDGQGKEVVFQTGTLPPEQELRQYWW